MIRWHCLSFALPLRFICQRDMIYAKGETMREHKFIVQKTQHKSHSSQTKKPKIYISKTTSFTYTKSESYDNQLYLHVRLLASYFAAEENRST